MDFITNIPFLLSGLKVTAELSVASLFFSLILGMVVALFGLNKSTILRWISVAFVELFRNIPSIVQLYWIYYVVPAVWNVILSPFLSATLAFSMNGGAYVAEILRGSILAVSKGQWEAARALGLSEWHMLSRIILPQAARIAIPPIINEVSRQIKSTSLASTIALPDLLYVSSSLSSQTFSPTLYITAGAVAYFVLIFPFSALSRGIEKSLGKAHLAG